MIKFMKQTRHLTTYSPTGRTKNITSNCITCKRTRDLLLVVSNPLIYLEQVIQIHSVSMSAI